MWKQRLWWLQHFISGIRGIGGFLLVVIASDVVAFWSALGFHFTDALDGWAAKWTRNNSTAGKVWVDPGADYMLGFWALLRWVNLSRDRVRITIFATILLVGFVGKILKQQQRYARLRHLFYGALPLYYLSLSWIFMYAYGLQAYPHSQLALQAIAVFSAVMFAYAKRDRLDEWFNHIDIALRKKKNPVAD